MSDLVDLLADPESREVILRHVRKFTFNALADDVRGVSPDSDIFDVTVEWRGPGDKWAVVSRSSNVNRRGGTSYESTPSNRTNRFKNAYRFPLDEAIVIAEKYARTAKLLGPWNAEAFNERYRERLAELEAIRNEQDKNQ